MATYKLIPSSLITGDYVTNESNAYSDTESDTYAYASLQKSTNLPCSSYAFLGGFDWDSIPNIEDAVSITVKVKCYSGSSSMDVWLASFDNPYNNAPANGILSNSVSVGTRVGVRTLTLSKTVEETLPYLRTSCLTFWNNNVNDNYTVYFYGAEIIVETTDPVPAKGKNKIMYGNQELIDLTSDTVDARDVRNGETFHLPSGVQSVGKLIPYIKTATGQRNSHISSISFTNLVKEPSWFVIICSCAPSTSGGMYRVMSVVYNGSMLIVNRRIGSNTTNGGVIRPTTHEGSFVYSDGTLTFSISDDYGYVQYGEYTLYYL